MLGTLATRLLTGAAPPIAVLAVAAVVGMILTDATIFPSQPFRDLGIYVKAGRHFIDGARVYSDTLLTAVPPDRTDYPYLYPPFTLPFAALLAALPYDVVKVLWTSGCVAAALAAFALIGIRRRWWIPLLLWPPVFQGLYVGNVAVPAALLFAAGPWFGGGLIVAAGFKVYAGLAGVWLVRERRWRAIVVGVGVLAGLTVLTFPLTGLERWMEWLTGLLRFRDSQALLPDYLYGTSLPRYLPWIVAIVIAVAFVAASWLARRTEGLARFGVATIVASPSLYAHGFIVALPAIATLRLRWAWLAVAIMSVSPGVSWWLAIALVAASWFALALRRPSLHLPVETSPAVGGEGRGGEVSRWDLLGGAPRPWPTASSPDRVRG
ncbi:MAG TPA: glycosyltransferase family 87 protein [Candidatus Limnocylindrales bacterium]|nr:glycosyltransferase family 87 protein [Candidatus Limnocylindrales bacterium]